MSIIIVATQIRSCNDFQGVKVKNDLTKYSKITQLADDNTLFLQNENEIRKALQTIEYFAEHSDLCG